MPLTSKQRSQLRSLAQSEDTIIMVGKGGITDNLVKQVSDALDARELIKGKVLESSLLTAREACDELARLCSAEGVQTIGNKFILYRRNEKEPRIELVKAKREK